MPDELRDAALRRLNEQVAVVRAVRHTLETAEHLLASLIADARRHGASEHHIAELTDLPVNAIRELVALQGE
jgi:hypothetical protein